MGDEVTQNSEVILYSGHTYAQRPVALVVSNRRLEISGIETEWSSPSGKGFKVTTQDGGRYKCDYYEHGDYWQVTPA